LKTNSLKAVAERQKIFFLLEDHPDRVREMRAVIAADFADQQIQVTDDAPDAIEWLAEHQSEVDLISLDHDMDSGERNESPRRDHGCGRDVADFLASRPATCPVIVHTSNAVAGDGMYFALHRAGWPVWRVWPHSEHDWIKSDWRETVRRVLEKFP
jgi:CheY-like chemotaxis protein